MLDAIRSNTQSFGVKAAFGVIILVFVFWGVGSFTEGDASRLMANVNGESILEPEFYKQYNRVTEQLSRQGVTREQMKAEQIGRKILQNLIAHTLVRQEARRIGLDITPYELRLAIQENTLFHNEKGEFTAESYTRGLAALRMSAADFESDVRNELLYEKMLTLISSAVWLPEDAARKHYDFLFEKRRFDTLFVPAAEFMKSVSVTDEECTTYYDNNKILFRIPKKAVLTYCTIRPEKLVSPQSIAEEEAKAWYEANKQRYTVEEAVKASHILVPLAANATKEDRAKAQEKIAEIQKALKGGKSFAALADEYNQAGAAGKGGDLGWIKRGATVEPFEKAAFSQKPGTISATPIETQFGLHLISVQEHRPEKIQTFAEVAEDVRANLALEKGRDKITEVGETLLEDTLLGKDMREKATQYGLSVTTTEPLSATELSEKLSLSAQDAALILSGTPIDTLLQAGDAVLVVKVDSLEKERTQDFPSVQADIKTRLTKEKALKEAMAKAATLLKTLNDGPLTAETRKTLGLTQTAELERQSNIPPYLPNQDLHRQAFEGKPETWLKTPFAVTKEDGTQGALLVRVAERIRANSEDWERIHTVLERGAERDAAEQIRTIFLEQLFKKAKISSVNIEKADRYDG